MSCHICQTYCANIQPINQSKMVLFCCKLCLNTYIRAIRQKRVYTVINSILFICGIISLSIVPESVKISSEDKILTGYITPRL